MWLRVVTDDRWKQVRKYLEGKGELHNIDLVYAHKVAHRLYSLVGYFLSFFLWIVVFLLLLWHPELFSSLSLSGLLLLLPLSFAALFLGYGPTLFIVPPSILALYFMQAPFLSGSGASDWSEMALLLLFTLLSTAIAILAYQREDAHRSLPGTEQVSDAPETCQRMEEMMSQICHELKTPLTAISVNAQLAQMRLKQLSRSEETGIDQSTWQHTITEVQRSLGRVECQVKVQSRMVNDLLDISRLQQDKLALILATHNMADIVRDSVQEQRQLAPTRVIQLEIPAGERFPVVADADRLKQVITNYLLNACKYAPVERPITVLLQQDGERVRVAVRDEGPGLSSGEQEAIWKRFYQAPGVKSCNGMNIGLGLGLHICRSIIEHHHGQVGVESTPGKGSTFWFTLPLEQPCLVNG